MITLIPWIGGKGKLIPVLRDMMPRNFNHFVDVFGGGGTVTFNLPMRKNVQRVYNDLNGNLTNLMRVVREQTLALLVELGFIPLHSRDEFNVLCKFLRKERFTDEYMQQEMDLADIYFDPVDAETLKELLRANGKLNPVVRAAAFYKVMRGSFSGTGDSYGAKPMNIRQFFHQIWRVSDILQNVIVENRTYEEAIRQYDRKKGLVYCDPPYYSTEKYYEAIFSLADHLRLNELFKELKGYGMLSYNDCEFIRELYKDFYIFRVERPDSLSQKEGQMYVELIITNYDPREHTSQMSLLDQISGGCVLIHEPENKQFIKTWR